MILFCKNKTKTIWIVSRCFDFLRFVWFSPQAFLFAEWLCKMSRTWRCMLERRNCWKGARREVWKEIEVGKWKVTELESDFHSYPSVVKEGCDL